MMPQQQDAFIALVIIGFFVFTLDPRNTLLWASRLCAAIGITFILMDYRTQENHKMVNGTS